MKNYISTMAFVVLALPAGVFAQTGHGDVDGSQSDRPAEAVEYTFDDDNVEAETLKPEALDISAQQHSKTRTLIKVRTNFLPELLESVDDI